MVIYKCDRCGKESKELKPFHCPFHNEEYEQKSESGNNPFAFQSGNNPFAFFHKQPKFKVIEIGLCQTCSDLIYRFLSHQENGLPISKVAKGGS